MNLEYFKRTDRRERYWNEWLRNKRSESSERQWLLGIHKGGDDPMEMVGHKLDIDGMEWNISFKNSVCLLFFISYSLNIQMIDFLNLWQNGFYVIAGFALRRCCLGTTKKILPQADTFWHEEINKKLILSSFNSFR